MNIIQSKRTSLSESDGRSRLGNGGCRSWLYRYLGHIQIVRPTRNLSFLSTHKTGHDMHGECISLVRDLENVPHSTREQRAKPTSLYIGQPKNDSPVTVQLCFIAGAHTSLHN